MADRRTAILEAASRSIARRGVRGLRVEEIAQEAGVSLGLIYYHFTDRAGLLRQALEFVNARATAYTEDAVGTAATPRERLELVLRLELGDGELVRENSAAWGELRASAVFEPELREPLRDVTASWNRDIAEAIERAQDSGEIRADLDPAAAAERLTSLIEGLSTRWLSGSLAAERARALLLDVIALELDGTRRVRGPRVAHRNSGA
jgi:AcrR family transcriptional regulator